MRLLTICVTGILLGQPVCGLAHSDPAGDIHPRIVVEAERFVIYFANNQETEPPRSYRTGTHWFDPWMNVYKTEISTKGKVLSERVKTDNPKVEAKKRYWTWEYGEDGKFSIVEEEKRFPISPKWRRKIEHIEDVVWEGDRIWAVFAYPYTTSPYDPYPFYFASIERTTGAAVVSEPIGNPSRIYHFPVASRLIRVGNYIYTVWARAIPAGQMDVPIEGGETVKMDVVQPELILSRFDVRSGALSHAKIEEPASTNLSIDIDAIDSKLLITHHAGGKIHWKVIDLATQRFTPKLKDEQGGADQPATAGESK